jgi:hypothetical protein
MLCAIAHRLEGSKQRLVNVSGLRGRVLRALIRCSQRRDHFSFAQRANPVRSANHPAAAGPSAGRDRVLAVRRSPKPRAFPDQGRKYTAGFENAFAARGDARPPCQVSSTVILTRIRQLPDEAHPTSGTSRSPSQSPSHAAFLGWRARIFPGRVSLSEPFFAFVAGTGFVYSAKLGQMVARPQWMQSGFCE